MKGHTLPGIKQRKSNKMADGRPSSSPFQHAAYGSPHPKNAETGAEEASHPSSAAAHNVKPEKESPAKWAQFIPMALSAMSSMKKNK